MSEAWFDLPPNWQTVYFWVDSKEKAVTDDIQKVREAYKEAAKEAGFPRESYDSRLPDFFAALAKRLQPRPEPVKKEWCVKLKTADRFLKTYGTIAERLDSVSADIISDRPDLVAAEWERQHRNTWGSDEKTRSERKRLFPELDP